MSNLQLTSTPHRAARGRFILRVALAVALACGLATACSDDDEPSASTTTEDTAAEGAGTETDGPAGASTSSSPADTEGGVDDGGSEVTEPSAPSTTAPLPELSDQEQTYVDALMDDVEDGDQLVPGVDTECLAVNWVKVIGGDTLADAGLTPEAFAEEGPQAAGLDRATAEEMVDSMANCGAGVESFYGIFASSFGVDPESDVEVIECMKDAVPVDELRDAMVDMFTVAGEDLSSLGESFEACLPVSE